MIVITDHAYDRAKERLSLNKSAIDRLALTAYEKGLKHSEAKSHLYKYVTKIWMSYKTANNVRIYGENIFLFHDNILITLYQVPFDLRKYIKFSK
jgi:hypothetical protein